MPVKPQTIADRHVKCPECGAEFEVETILRDTIERELRETLTREISDRLKEQLQTQIQQAAEEKYQQEIAQLKAKSKVQSKKQLEELEDAKAENAQLLKEKEELKKSKLELEKTRLKLQSMQDSMEHNITIASEEARIKAKKELQQTYQEWLSLEVKKAVADKDIELAEKTAKEQQLKSQLDELQQKLEQGSMQLQGEGLELAIEDTLRQFYPRDYINEIKKGQHGADISQTVIDSSGIPCGKILYEAKRAKNWGKDWVDKLRHDGLAEKADLLVLVSTVLPDNAKGFQQIEDNLFVCQYHEVGIVTGLLRNTLIKVNAEKALQDNRLTIRDRLADYLVSDEFLQSFRLIWEGYKSFQDILAQEERSFKRQMAAKRKSLERILEAQASITGTIEAIGRNPISDRILEQSQDFYLSE